MTTATLPETPEAEAQSASALQRADTINTGLVAGLSSAAAALVLCAVAVLAARRAGLLVLLCETKPLTRLSTGTKVRLVRPALRRRRPAKKHTADGGRAPTGEWENVNANADDDEAREVRSRRITFEMADMVRTGGVRRATVSRAERAREPAPAIQPPMTVTSVITVEPSAAGERMAAKIIADEDEGRVAREKAALEETAVARLRMEEATKVAAEKTKAAKAAAEKAAAASAALMASLSKSAAGGGEELGYGRSRLQRARPAELTALPAMSSAEAARSAALVAAKLAPLAVVTMPPAAEMTLPTSSLMSSFAISDHADGMLAEGGRERRGTVVGLGETVSGDL